MLPLVQFFMVLGVVGGLMYHVSEIMDRKAFMYYTICLSELHPWYCGFTTDASATE